MLDGGISNYMSPPPGYSEWIKSKKIKENRDKSINNILKKSFLTRLKNIFKL